MFRRSWHDRGWWRRVTVLGTALLLLTSCGPGTDDSETTLTVAAAASLTEAFEAIAEGFEADHPEVSVTFTFDSSDALAHQIIEGAPAEVFASASQETTEKVVDAGLVDGRPVTFARNALIIVTKPGNPEGITSLADLADTGVIAICGETVPCGTAAATALETAGVAIPERRVTRGQNVKATLSAVSEGDATAGLVYVTDARAAGDAVDVVAIPEAHNAVVAYPISVLADAADPSTARAFVDYVRSDEGQRTLQAAGFLAPS